MKHAVMLPFLLPMAAAIVCLFAHRAGIMFQRIVSLTAVLVSLGVGILLVWRAAHGEVAAYAVGDWRAPFGIILVVDRLSAAMLLLTAVLALPALLYAMAGTDEKGRLFHPLFQLQLVGINGAFLTGDIFNMFVFFEVLLLASYGLLVHGGGALRARAGIAYVVLNLAGSALFLVALALVYGTLGTLNIADMSMVLPQVPDSGQALVRTAMAFLVIVFALKAALLPLSFWLPLAYGSAAAAVAALFAVLTKVGVYALLRVSQIVFPAASFTADLLEPWLVVLAVLTIATGTIGALAAARLATVVAYLVVMSTGSLLAAIAVPGVATNAAVIYYIIHSTLITGGFFLLADTIAGQRGAHGDQLVRGARMRDMGSLGAAFLVLGIGVSGVPPLSGFFGKFMIMKSVQESDWMAPVWTALLFSSLLVALALARAASVIFWEPRPEVPSPERVPPSRLRTLALVFLLAASPALTVATAPVSGYAHAAAEQLLAREGYVSAVLGTAPHIKRELRPR